MEDLARRAVVGTQMFVERVADLPDAPVEGAPDFKFGTTRATSLIPRPPPEFSPSAASRLAELREADDALRDALLEAVQSGSELHKGWAERITPLDHTLIPHDLLHQLPDFDDSRLDRVLLSPVYEPLPTVWVPLPPPQPPTSPGEPGCIKSWHELVLPEAERKITAWLAHARADMNSIDRQLDQGVPPDEITRDRPLPIAIGQTEMQPWAVGKVYDCTKRHSHCCTISDFGEPIQTHLEVGFLRERLQHYPDQALVSYLLEGVRLEADVELQAVLDRHLSSVQMGWASIERELHRKSELGWYVLHDDFAYFPSYLLGKGAAARKLEPDRWRETTEGGGPRIPTFDASGLQAISINDASRQYHMPRHFAEEAARRPEFAAWLRLRGLPRAPSALPQTRAHIFSKWPKEVKGSLEACMRDNAILARAAFVMSTVVYGMGDDFKDHFQQLAMSKCELHKLLHVFLGSRPAGGGERPLVFVEDRRLGFGTHPASNIAQRYSDALLAIFREMMDVDEQPAERARAGSMPEGERLWLQARLDLQRRQGIPCVDIHRLTRRAAQQLPPIAAPASVDAIPDGYVCPQLRLYSCYIYTDDPQFEFVGVSRTLTGIRNWRRLTDAVNAYMAIEEKRSLGVWCKWLGVVLVLALGVVVVPRSKLLRASAVISDTLLDATPFHVYRSLCGLLEHLRAISLTGRNVMHGLYRPHSRQCDDGQGPNSVVVCDLLMRKQLQRWLNLLLRSSGVSCKRALFRSELETGAGWFVDVTSDACYADVAEPGVGGFCHGLFWLFVVPPSDVPYLSIPILEFLGVVGNFLSFHTYLAHACAGSDIGATELIFRTDALTAALTLPAESMKSPLLVEAFQWLRARAEFQDLAPCVKVAHLFGDCNPFSDLISRQRWAEFARLCKQCGLSPHRVTLPPAFAELYQFVIEAAKRERRDGSRTAGVSASQTPPPAPAFSSFRVGSLSADSPSAGAALSKLRGMSSPPPITPPAAYLVADPLPGGAALQGAQKGGSAAPSSTPPVTPPLRPPPLHSTSRGREPYLSQLRPGATLPSPTPRVVGGLQLPPAPPRTRPSSSLLRAGAVFARQRAEQFAGGHDDMAFRLPLDDLVGITTAMEDAVAQGIPPGTAQKDDLAWDLWEVVCDAHCTSPFRTAKDARDFPERNAHLLAVLTLVAFSVAKPKSKSRVFIKPGSALAYPLAVIRIFGRWGVAMPSYRFLRAHIQTLVQIFQEYHGPLSLSPTRVEPMKFAMVRRIDLLEEGTMVVSLRWDYRDHHVYMFRRLNRFLIYTAFRLGEICGQRRRTDGNGGVFVKKIHYLTFDSVNFFFEGRWLTRLTDAQCRSFRPGRDKVAITPPLAKADQSGEIHCPFPVYLTYDTDHINAAAAILDIERHFGVRLSDEERRTTALFHDQQGQPYEHHFLHSLLRTVLTHLYGAQTASVFSFHSYRAGLATALHAAGVEDSMIQLICRWMCPESLHRYRVVGLREHEHYINKASDYSVDSIQSSNVPKVANNTGFANMLAELVEANSAPAKRLASQYDAEHAKAVSSATDHAAPSLKRATLPAALLSEPAQPTPLVQPSAFQPGMPIVVSRSAWPAETCTEHGGAGWAATVRRVSGSACRISFTVARTRDGRPYADAVVPKVHLLLPA